MAWVGRDLTDHLLPTPLPWARTPATRPGCIKPPPTPTNLSAVVAEAETLV